MITQKVDNLRRLELGEAASKLVQEYGIGTTTINDLKSQKERIMKFYSEIDSSKGIAKCKNIRKS